MSASVFKPCVLDIPRMRSPLADRRQLLCRGEAFTRVRRVLFEPVDHAETQEFLEKELAKQSIRQLKKWDFNFALEAPLNNPTRYEWTAIISQKNNAAPKKRAARNNVENQQNQEDKSEALYPNFLHEIDEFEKQKKQKQQQQQSAQLLTEQEQEAQAKERISSSTSSSTSNSNNSSTNNQRREKRKTKQEAENEKQNQNVESIEFDESSPLPKKQRLITDFMSMRKQLPSTLMKKKLSSSTTTPKRITTSTTDAAEKSNSNSSSSVPTTNPCNVQPAR